jgi:hypothetical protein
MTEKDELGKLVRWKCLMDYQVMTLLVDNDVSVHLNKQETSFNAINKIDRIW